MQIDRQLCSAIAKGDEKIIFQLYRHCYEDLVIVCRRYVQNEDEVGTLLNTAFMKILKSINNYQNHVPFTAWIRRIMINTAIDSYRKNRKYQETMEFSDTPMEQVETRHLDFNEADQSFDAEQLLNLIRSLPPMTNQVFNLFAIDGYSHKEIAGMLDMSEGTSKWHLSTARKKLQEMLKLEMKSKKNTADDRAAVTKASINYEC
jgi:RNA polymerase sigma-70 factor (ECF subfamily)